VDRLRHTGVKARLSRAVQRRHPATAAVGPAPAHSAGVVIGPAPCRPRVTYRPLSRLRGSQFGVNISQCATTAHAVAYGRRNAIIAGPAMQPETPALLSESLLRTLAERGDLRDYGRGEILIQEGELSDALYILVSGQVKVYTRDERGRELIYNILQPGEFFGEMFLDGGVRSASAKAVDPVRCVLVGPAEFRSFMQVYPEFAECLVLKLIARVRHATGQTRSLAFSGVYERTVDVLNRVSVDEDGARVVPLGVTQQEIADRVGATREMVNHILRDLARGGFLDRDDQRRTVLVKELPKHW
jgi:CRP/FNR family cyclic AMP-dependent transcriptional regulator